LLVEDEDGVRGLAVLVLQTYGYKVLAADNGKEAMRLVEKHQGGIGLLVTDVVMPAMGGADLAEALRPRFPQMKVLSVVVTRTMLWSGTVSYMKKLPFSRSRTRHSPGQESATGLGREVTRGKQRCQERVRNRFNSKPSFPSWRAT